MASTGHTACMAQASTNLSEAFHHNDSGKALVEPLATALAQAIARSYTLLLHAATEHQTGWPAADHYA